MPQICRRSGRAAPDSRVADPTAAFVAAAEAAYPSMVRYAGAIAGRDHGEDAAQEALLKAWRYLGSFKGEGSFDGWLFKICRRTALDVAARSRRNVMVADAAIDEHAVNASLRSASTESSASELELMVLSLPTAERDAFALTQLAGLTYVETSDALDIPVGTVRSRVARARRILTDEIRDAEAS